MSCCNAARHARKRGASDRGQDSRVGAAEAAAVEVGIAVPVELLLPGDYQYRDSASIGIAEINREI